METTGINRALKPVGRGLFLGLRSVALPGLQGLI